MIFLAPAKGIRPCAAKILSSIRMSPTCQRRGIVSLSRTARICASVAESIVEPSPKDTTKKSLAEDTLIFEEVDARITYPSYKSFDEFIDKERLRWLDGYITQKIRRRMNAQMDYKFYTGPYKLDNAVADRPGSRMIYLAYSEKPDSYFDLDRTEFWHPTEATNEFALLSDFIRTLPFKSTGRMLIMYDDAPREVPAHRDHVETDICHEFLWFRTNMKKPFYMLNHVNGEKKYVDILQRLV